MHLTSRFRRLFNRIVGGLLIAVFILSLYPLRVYADDEKLQQIKDTLKKYYIGELPKSVLEATTMEEILKFLNDPYTQYFTGIEFQDMLNYVDMSFLGIGVDIEMVPEGAKVISVMIDSPAMEVGVKEGDVIVSAGDYPLSGLKYNQALSCINGKENEFISLKIIRNGNSMDYKIMPRKITYPTVVGEIINGHIGYIRIISFGSITHEEFYKKVQELKAGNADSFIIDIRNNSGGYLYSAINISGCFIGTNIAVILEDKVNGKVRIKPENTKEQINEPVVFLINEFTASASEILCTTVRYYNKGLFVGENTYGKNVAQTMFQLNDGSVLKTTTVKFFTPNGREINNTGISPNLKVNNVDPLLAAELLLGRHNSSLQNNIGTKIKIENKEYEINFNDIRNKEYWEAFRNILSKAQSIKMVRETDAKPNSQSMRAKIPQIEFAEAPLTNYKPGDRLSLKLNAPGYDKRVQYRAILWDEENNSYRDLWDTKDCYYDSWKPKGNEIFTIGFPVMKPGNYRIKVFAKRADTDNKSAYLKGMNCDSYVCDIPFVVTPIS